MDTGTLIIVINMLMVIVPTALTCRFVVNANVGKTLPVTQLAATHDSVLLAVGAGKPRDLPVEGRNLKVRECVRACVQRRAC